METLWFCLVALMLAAYVIFDGYDLGAGIVHLWVARTDEETRLVLRTIGPVWDGNEVWLLAAGGTLYFAFPVLYAASFSGFYLPLMMVLWLLILRGIAIEFRGHVEAPVWKPFWDAVFAGASALLTIFFGAALGNVVRGVPLDASQNFFLPLWTDFNIGPEAGILDWYTVLVGLLAFFTLTVHGALWVSLKTSGDLQERSRRLANRAWWGVVALTIAVTAITFSIQPLVSASFRQHPWGYVFPGLALIGLIGMPDFSDGTKSMRSILASCIFIAGMLTSAAFGLFPYVLPSNTDPNLGLTVYNTATAPYGLKVGLAWFIPGMILVIGYVTYVHRLFAGKVTLEGEGY
jgi:cytochrome d ubiquinol oxidase subunit II